MQKTKLAWIGGILMAVSLTTTIAQDKKNNPPAAGQSAKVETIKRDLLSAVSAEKLAKVALTEKSPDSIVGKRFSLSGPLVTLVKSDDPLQRFNPFAVSNSRVQSDPVRLDPYLRPPRGFTLFRLEF